MAFRLAARVGRVDVDQMLAELDSREFDEWIAYDKLEPISDELNRETLILIGTAICRALSMDVKPDDFRLLKGKKQREKPQSVASLKANLAMFAQLHNASVRS